MIRVNDRQDPQQPSVPVPGAEIIDYAGDTRRFLVPMDSELAARLNGTPNPESRFNVALGDPADAVEGEEPPIWYGVIQAWQPSGSKIMVTCRAARTIEEGVHTSPDSSTLSVPPFPRSW
ncbi:hypothetical protein [Nocardia sp. CC227C]|uniref:hypothetical protein n=1 Tax=Nocardia sp. CC227C TaxID=3044562 RepID=UPI00278C30A5|nr:hypothetical protein [Nocardia sp. CC227C]